MLGIKYFQFGTLGCMYSGKAKIHFSEVPYHDMASLIFPKLIKKKCLCRRQCQIWQWQYYLFFSNQCNKFLTLVIFTL